MAGNTQAKLQRSDGRVAHVLPETPSLGRCQGPAARHTRRNQRALHHRCKPVRRRPSRTAQARDSEKERHMTVNDLERLYDYGYWANQKLLAVVSHLTPEQFTQTVAG